MLPNLWVLPDNSVIKNQYVDSTISDEIIKPDCAKLIEILYNCLYNILSQNSTYENDATLINNNSNFRKFKQPADKSTELSSIYSGEIDRQLYETYKKSFPPKEMHAYCGQLACLSPINRNVITEITKKIVNQEDSLSIRTSRILCIWLNEIYGEEPNDTKCGDGIQCNGCQKNLKVYMIRIRCLDCVDYDLCVNCFSTEVETENHQIDHYYVALGVSTSYVFDHEWTIGEDLVLLEAIGKFGVGNWGEVQEWVSMATPENSDKKLRDDCMNRYFNHHVSCETSFSNLLKPFLYKDSLALLESIENEKKKKAQQTDNKSPNYEPLYNCNMIDMVRGSRNVPKKNYLSEKQVDSPFISFEPKSPNSNTKYLLDNSYTDTGKIDGKTTEEKLQLQSPIFKKIEINQMDENDSSIIKEDTSSKFDTSEQNSEYEYPVEPEPLKYQAAKPPNMLGSKVVISGYLPHRGDLDVEWENGAELHICDLNIREDETPMEKLAKFKALEAYNCILDERWVRKHLYLDKKIYERKTRTSSDAYDPYDAFKPLWKYMYPNYSYYPVALFNRNKKYYDISSSLNNELLLDDLTEMSTIISDDRKLLKKLELLTLWWEAGIKTIEEALYKGVQIAQAVGKVLPITNFISLEHDDSQELETWLKEQLKLNQKEFKLFLDNITEKIKNNIRDDTGVIVVSDIELKSDNSNTKNGS